MNGLLVIDKPQGRSSFWAVAKIRGITGVKKAGHAGALDPLATGVLVVGLGRATRVMKSVEALEKTYAAVMQLGSATDTDDADGRPLYVREVPDLSIEKIQEVFAPFTGKIMQRPPAYSAVKIRGVRAYKRARRGETFETNPREIEIRELTVTGYDPALKRIAFRMRSSKGTYVRSLARDVGERLGCGAHLLALRRESVGKMSVAHALRLDPEPSREDIEKALIPVEDTAAGLPAGIPADENHRKS